MLPDKILQEGKEINFLTYCSDGQPNWFDKPHTATFIWLTATGCYAERWRLGECCCAPWAGWGNQSQFLMSSTSNDAVTAASDTAWLLPPLWGGLGYPAYRQLRDFSGGKVSVGGRGEYATVKQNCLIHLLWWKIKAIVECDTCRSGWQNMQPF